MIPALEWIEDAFSLSTDAAEGAAEPDMKRVAQGRLADVINSIIALHEMELEGSLQRDLVQVMLGARDEIIYLEQQP